MEETKGLAIFLCFLRYHGATVGQSSFKHHFPNGSAWECRGVKAKGTDCSQVWTRSFPRPVISTANLPDLLLEQNLSHENFENCQNELLIYRLLCLASNNPPCPGTRKDQESGLQFLSGHVDVEVQTQCCFSQTWQPSQCHKGFCLSKHQEGPASSSKHQVCLVSEDLARAGKQRHSCREAAW